MANPNQHTGRATVKADGRTIHAGNVKLDPGGPVREPVGGDYSAGGFKYGEPKPAKVELDAQSKGSFSPTAIAAMDDVTLSVEFDTGQAFVIRHAWTEGAPTVDTSSGKAPVVFYGPPAEEVR
ncbi:phage tail tube protein [Sphingomonas sp. AOB5]|uniref:phage tail tube protein n=1 Tax=Sphingomonas sp. AOB5 TaxID=3034017 RepID=UPI0023F79FCF|nr:phage tail tube protein [Sphingomonas sp. AOB5]MDF7776867.1 phage tail tube protein [Sphingomonas sp. AOB5]